MNEKVLNNQKNGMLVLLLVIALYVAAGAALAWSITSGSIPVLVISVVWLSLGWIFLAGLKVLKPQEALVLTLFGQYVGTLKENGFYFVNPFCTSVNPAAKTKLNQSGDVDGGKRAMLTLKTAEGGAEFETTSKKTYISSRTYPRYSMLSRTLVSKEV